MKKLKNLVVNNTNTQLNSLNRFGSPYNFRFLNRNPLNTSDKKNDFIYTFVSQKSGLKYYVNCIEYRIGVYAVKFYLKIHKQNPNKYRMVINNGDAIPVLKTVISIMLDILNKDEFASFAFIGMPKENELNNSTKRYCVYREFCKKYFNPNSFDHLYDETWSFYSLLNRKRNVDLIIKELSRLAKEELKDDGVVREQVSLGRSTHSIRS